MKIKDTIIILAIVTFMSLFSNVWGTKFFSSLRERMTKDVCSLIDITYFYAIIMRYT